MISGGLEDNSLGQICLVLQAKFRDDPLSKLYK